MKLTHRISKQSLYTSLILVFPTYLYAGSYIISALMLFIMSAFQLSLESNELNAVFQFVFDLILILFTVVVLRNELKEQFVDLKNRGFYKIASYAVMGLPLLYLGSFLGNIISALCSGGSTQSVNQTQIETLAAQVPVLMIVSVTIFAPILEESLFRLVLFTGSYPVNRWFAYLVSGGLFGFLHVFSSVFAGNFKEIFMVFPYLLMGFGLCYVYEKADNIYASMLTHGIMNFISIMLILS